MTSVPPNRQDHRRPCPSYPHAHFELTPDAGTRVIDCDGTEIAADDLRSDAVKQHFADGVVKLALEALDTRFGPNVRRLLTEDELLAWTYVWLGNDPTGDYRARFTAGLDRLVAEARARRSAEQGEPMPPAPKRMRRPNPRRLAKWEAAWQAERDAEAES